MRCSTSQPPPISAETGGICPTPHIAPPPRFGSTHFPLHATSPLPTFLPLIFVLIGWTGPEYYVTALSVGGIVCIAASNGGSTSQDLKTGYLLGATPRHQQVAILIGAAASALVLGSILLQLNSKGTLYIPAAKAAPGLHASAGAVFAGT